MADEQQVQGVWEFDLSKWTLDDVVQFEKATTLEQRLPIMMTAIVQTPVLPLNFDPNDPESRKKVSLAAWADLQRRFSRALENIFR